MLCDALSTVKTLYTIHTMNILCQKCMMHLQKYYVKKEICMGQGSTESTCCLDPKAWCLADGYKYSYDFDGLSGNSTLEL